MIEVISKSGEASNVGDGRALTVRIGKRVRSFLVRPGSVKELRTVGKRKLYCRVADQFLAGELQAVASCSAVQSNSIN